MILTGVSLNTAVALFAGAGVGAVVSLGGGVMVKTGACLFCVRVCFVSVFVVSWSIKWRVGGGQGTD